MKFILSRKGFDSQFGGHPSPVLPDDTMLSLPIPEVDSQMLAQDTGCRYCELNLLSFPINGCFCHLDPDIRPELHKNLPDNWCAVLGQCGAAAKHLLNEKVDTGDIFLFFGLFQHWNRQDGFTGKPFHAIWGYMQIDKLINLKDDPGAVRTYSWHPHTKVCLNDNKVEHASNMLFTATDHLSIMPDIAGYGVFKFASELQLTLPDNDLVTHWNYASLPWVDMASSKPNMTYHTEDSLQADYFQAAYRGQEFVIAENKTSIVLSHFKKLLTYTNKDYL